MHVVGLINSQRLGCFLCGKAKLFNVSHGVSNQHIRLKAHSSRTEWEQSDDMMLSLENIQRPIYHSKQNHTFAVYMLGKIECINQTLILSISYGKINSSYDTNTSCHPKYTAHFIYKKLHLKNVYSAYTFVVFIHCRSKGYISNQ